MKQFKKIESTEGVFYVNKNNVDFLEAKKEPGKQQYKIFIDDACIGFAETEEEAEAQIEKLIGELEK